MTDTPRLVLDDPTPGEDVLVTDIEGLGAFISEVIEIDNRVIVRLSDEKVEDMIGAIGATREGALRSAYEALAQRREAQTRAETEDDPNAIIG